MIRSCSNSEKQEKQTFSDIFHQQQKTSILNSSSNGVRRLTYQTWEVWRPPTQSSARNVLFSRCDLSNLCKEEDGKKMWRLFCMKCYWRNSILGIRWTLKNARRSKKQGVSKWKKNFLSSQKKILLHGKKYFQKLPDHSNLVSYYVFMSMKDILLLIL